MEYLIVCTVATVVAALTFFSGFGLGTLLMPAFALFFPLEVAIAATAIVHLLNNLFKVYLVGRDASKKVILLFALPASISAFGGAWLLNSFSVMPPLVKYTLGNSTFQIIPLNLVIAVLMIIFAVFEWIPALSNLTFSQRYIPVGGMLSGFFGGLSGHQGALRTAFLVRAGLAKRTLIGTMVVSSVIVDIARLLIYGITFFERDFNLLLKKGGIYLVVAGSLAAFAGSFFGSRLLEKVTLSYLKSFIAIMLLLIALALGSGLI